ncbi:MAG: SpoIIIAC/SpoIIIAD family protein [Clostridia bacterium]|nr:SpoIIIAC/SpoIIIAD family protein [Clostridia bacterium]
MKAVSLLTIALIGTVLTVFLQGERREYGAISAIVTGGILLIMIADELTGLFDAVRLIMEKYGIATEYLSIMLKTVGIAYLCHFGMTLCKDAGQSAIAAKLEIGGRILIMTCALPAVLGLIEAGGELLSRLGS